jgi:flagellar basal-body rod protein FlgG
VSVVLPGSPNAVQVGTVQLTDFVNPAGLQPRGQNLFVETVSSGPPQPGTPGLNGLGTIGQGSLETSNVNVVEELVAMIETQRAYEMNSRAVETSDQMLRHLTTSL